jgi:ribulose-5-phosphate 4-epimerase/fuculose-1-phosphate aldolase
MTSASITPSVDVVSQAKIDLAAAFRACALHGFSEGIDNHFSLAVPGRDDLFLLNRFGPDWSELTASDLLAVEADGSVVEGEGAWATPAFMLHRGIHLARPTARCVFHTHMPFATAVALTRDGLDTTLSQNAMYFHRRVLTLPYGGVADAVEEGERIGGAIGEDVTVVFLENHGVLVIGSDVADAWHKLYFLERACQVQVLAQSTGRQLVHAPDAVVKKTAAQWVRDPEHARALFAAVKRRLDKEFPGYER